MRWGCFYWQSSITGEGSRLPHLQQKPPAKPMLWQPKGAPGKAVTLFHITLGWMLRWSGRTLLLWRFSPCYLPPNNLVALGSGRHKLRAKQKLSPDSSIYQWGGPNFRQYHDVPRSRGVFQKAFWMLFLQVLQVLLHIRVFFQHLKENNIVSHRIFSP